MALGQQRVALAISLILKLLENHASECGDIIVVHTNMGAFARYIEKDCYPSGLRRRQYIESILIHRLLCKPQAGSDGENRMMHPRQLKAASSPKEITLITCYLILKPRFCSERTKLNR